MSDDVTKTALRLHLPQLTGKDWTEAWEVIRPILGDKDQCSDFDFDDEEGEVLWFEYPNYRFHQRGEEWYVDNILAYDKSYEHPGLVMQVGTLADKSREFVEKFRGCWNGSILETINGVNVVVVSWYNGTDEPFEFDFGEGPITQ